MTRRRGGRRAARGRAAPSPARRHRRRARRDPRPPRRPRPERPRARDVQRDVERALLVQELAAAAADAADRRGRGRRRRARARTPASISIGDGLAVAFKIESHNHPSAVEPYQGAATGVGGILRDIFTMGARPIAVLDALRFGDPADRADAAPRRRRRARRRRLRQLRRRADGRRRARLRPVATQGNPLVNVMAIGLLEERHLTRAAAPGPGQPRRPVRLDDRPRRDRRGVRPRVSATFADDDPSKRPSVQVGDPFAEKLLIEASLELIERGLVEGLQDLGAGGITCATSETADRAGTGMRIDLDAIPRREPGMAPFEVMISRVARSGCSRSSEPDRWDDGRGGLRALGPAGRGDRPGDRRRRHRRSSTATARSSPGSRPRR